MAAKYGLYRTILEQTLTTNFRTGSDDERGEIFESKVVTIEGGVVISDGAWDSGLLFVCGTKWSIL
jgi:hypothetical protein